MDNEKEKWIADVFESMKGNQRAKPAPELFAKIESEINSSTAKVIPIRQWRYAAAAAALVLFVNVSALFYYQQNSGLAYEDVAVGDTYNQPLISDYQIYK